MSILRAFALLLTSVSFITAADKPNILFLFADDMTWKAVNALSDEDIDTPNLDRLAAQGTTFTHAYNSGGWHGAICVASRTMLNTGRQIWHAHDLEKGMKKDSPGDIRMWSQIMSDAGYRTCISGKWHVRVSADKIFEEALNIRPGMPRDGKNAYNRPVEGKPDPWDATNPKEGGFWQGGKHWSEVIVDDFNTFIGSEDERPWFMYLAFNAPHDPRQSPKEILDTYPLERMNLPVNFLPEYPYNVVMDAPHSLRDEKLAPMPRTEFAVKTHRREYYAIITHLDLQIGRILDRLAESPDAKNTYICFTADHGLGCGEHGLLGKQNMYDHSVRVPFIIAGPGVPAGAKLDAPIYLQDIMPTSIALAGAEIPKDCGFQNLQPHWEGKGTPRAAIYGAYKADAQRMLTKDGKKLILYPKGKVVRVFDLEKDPDEMNDLSDTEDGKRIAKELFVALLEEQKVMGDTLDLKPIYTDL